MNSQSSQQKIGLAVATIVGMNAMIGAGIFAAPAALASNVGPAGILSYAFVILAVWCMGSSIARLAYLYPQEGSFYTYAKQWGGHFLGLLSAGAYLFGLIIAMGLLAQVAGTYLHDGITTAFKQTWLIEYIPAASAWGIITLITLTVLNMIGVVLSEAGQLVLICCTVFPLLSTIILCLTNADIGNLTPFMPYGWTNILSATKAVIFGFFGFECAASLFNVVKQPEKNVPRALTLSIVLVGSLYLLFVMALILAVPLHLFSINIPLSQTLHTIFPHNKWLLIGIHISILSAVLGTIHSMLWSSSALLVSYLQQFKNRTIHRLIHHGIINQRVTVLTVGTGIFLSFLLLKNADLFFSFTAIFIVFAFTTAIITLLTRKQEWKNGENIKSLIGLSTALVIFYFALQGVIQHI